MKAQVAPMPQLPEIDNESSNKKIEKLSRIRHDIKSKAITVKEAISKLKLEELKEFDINEIESEEDAEYDPKPAGEKGFASQVTAAQQAPQLNYISKVNGSVIIRLG